MKDIYLFLRPAKGALSLCALSLTFSFAMAIGLNQYNTAKAQAIARDEVELQGARRKVQTLAADLAVLEAHLESFKQLVDIGLIGDPDRDLWVQKFEAIYQTLDLPPTLRYVLAPPQLHTDIRITAPGAMPLSQIKALRHDLNVELSGIHEGEFLAFIDTLRTDWQTPFRLETCQMKRQPEAGLQIKCTLRLFSLPVDNEGQQAGR